MNDRQRHVAGDVGWAGLAEVPPPFVEGKKRKPKGRKGLGVRYEKKVQRHLEDRWGVNYLPSPWINYNDRTAGRPRWCQPDGLLILPERGEIIICEVKYSHTEQAWWQLRQKYLPVVSKIFGKGWTYKCCEIVRWFDVATTFPGEIRMISSIEKCPARGVGVHICKPL